jgi:hypothetical protein
MRFEPKHVVTMVACVCAAVVLAPVGVMAATGSYVNITDPFSTARKARVSTDGALRVESRAGANSNTFSNASGDLTSNAFSTLAEATYPTRIAVTEMSFSVDSGIQAANTAYAARIEVYRMVRTSGTAACARTAPGWTAKLMRVAVVVPSEMRELTFAGSPLVLAGGGSGQRVCLGAYVSTYPTNTRVFIGATGYTFTP